MNKTTEIEITKLKLESMDSLSIYEWLEKNKKNHKHILNEKEIVKKLYDRKDKLINVGLAIYSRGYTYEMYKNTNNQEEKLAYLSSEVHFFVVEKGDIISELVAEYQECKLDSNKKELCKVEDKLKAFFSNEYIYAFRCVLFDLYCKTCRHKGRYKNRDDVFKDIDNELWLKLISYTSNQKILSEYDVTIDETFGLDACGDYLNNFWKLFTSVDVTKENAKMLVGMVEMHASIRQDHNFSCTLENLNRWQSDSEDTYFLFARYYLAKTNESLLSSESKDLAIRMAYYSSYGFVQELNKNLPDENKLEEMYGYRENYDYYVAKLEEYYSKDNDWFLTEIIENEYALSDNLLLQHALRKICDREIVASVSLRDKINEIDKKYPNRFIKYDDLTEVDKLVGEEEKNNFLLEKIQNIDSSSNENLQKLNELSFLPASIVRDTNTTHFLLIIIIILEIVNLFF